MKVLVIGSGGREHALIWKIAQSPLVTKIFAAPGNAGISSLAECVHLAADDIQGLLQFAKKESIDLTVVGPEAPLVSGIVDLFKNAGLKIFGPDKESAMLEGSKAFAKEKMEKFGIPTAAFEMFSNINEAKHYAIETEMPIVIKADGLAQGKGVVICESSQDAIAALTQIMAERAHGTAGDKVIIEKVLTGEEFSVLVLTDGETIIPLVSAQDHKRAYDHDKGPNTGGMGAYSPCPQIPEAKFQEIIDTTVKPMIKGLAEEGRPYRGLLYAGIMMTKEGPYVLEYNCRFGDPEAEVVLPRLKSDLVPVLLQIAEGKLQTRHLDWYDKACIGVVVASGGYPGHYQKGFPIRGLERASDFADAVVFHSGTAKNDRGEVVSSGGRVLCVVQLGATLREAHDKVYDVLRHINFEGGFFRKDIGRRAMEVLR